MARRSSGFEIDQVYQNDLVQGSLGCSSGWLFRLAKRRVHPRTHVDPQVRFVDLRSGL